MENKDWREQFLKIHYEPEHERGQRRGRKHIKRFKNTKII